MTAIKQVLQSATHQLTGVSSTAILDAELLLAFVLNAPRSYLYAHPEVTLTEDQAVRFSNCLARRLNNEPIAYITGHKEFWSLDLLVTEATLIPRPETELLIETILTFPLSPQSSIKAADLGTGCGAIALAIAKERPAWRIDAVDISEQALQVARQNAKDLNISNVSFHQGNWCEGLTDGNFHLIVSNPPYIAEAEWSDFVEGLKFEPSGALVSGSDGLSSIRQIAETAGAYLQIEGYLIVEHGFLQAEAVRAIFVANGYSDIHSVRDLAGHERLTFGRLLKR